MTTPNDILTFWFGESFQNGIPVENRNSLWFGYNPKLDLQIKHHYLEDVIKASLGDYDDWKEVPENRLALIILLDQFPRNIYRGSKQAFAFDEKALQLCLEGLELGHDRQLIPIYRSFYYLPLEHSESLSLQQRCVELFESFYAEVRPVIQETIKGSLDYARLHYEIIARFGRFPHRNSVLERQSTTEELVYLKESGVNFGQSSEQQR